MRNTSSWNDDDTDDDDTDDDGATLLRDRNEEEDDDGEHEEDEEEEAEGTDIFQIHSQSRPIFVCLVQLVDARQNQKHKIDRYVFLFLL